MATDMFLKVDDITGESQDAKHKNEIEVRAWTWGMSQPGTAHSGVGAGSGKVTVRDLTLVKHADRATPILMKMCCSGKHFVKATLVIRKAGSTPVESVRIVLSDGLVSGIKCGGGSEDEQLTESVRLNFASFKVEYTTQTAQGLPGPAVPAQWNIARNSES